MAVSSSSTDANSPRMANDLTTLDTALLRSRTGDRNAYRTVIQQADATVRVVVAAIVPDGSLIDDVTQEVFITAWSKLEDYSAGTDPLRWFKAIARNHALNARRGWLRHAANRQQYQADLAPVLEPSALAFAERIDAGILDVMDQCLQALGTSGRAVIHEHYWDGSSPEDIAFRRGRQAGWARVTLHRLRAMLGDCLAAKGVGRG
jgi:RNA polymerase sigma-70 factor, ECF subfamily